jgi:chemotaxis signal transduction protein
MSPPFLLVTFRVADAQYGFDVSDVVEVAATGEITPVPGTSERVAGVASWRGRTIPVLRLPEDLKREAVGPDQKCRLLVLSQPGAFAIRVDAPGQIVREWTPVNTPDHAAEPGMTRLLARVDDDLVRVLDPRRVVGDPATLLQAATPGGDACASTP